MLRCIIPKLLLFSSTLVFALLLSSHAATEISSKLNNRLTVNWQGLKLDAILDRLSSTQGVTLWLDRRVDPQQKINPIQMSVSFEEMLTNITAGRSLGWTILGETIYIGPRESSKDLATLAARVRQSASDTPADYRSRWLTAEPTSWARLSDPRDILEKWFKDAGIKLLNPQVLPHDLWAAESLPPMNLADRSTLLLLTFDMTCEVASNGRSCRITPIKRPVLITETHHAGSKVRDVLTAFKDKKNVNIQRNGQQLEITARWEDQQLVADIIDDAKLINTQGNISHRVSEQRFSLKLENKPVGNVIDQLAAQLGLRVTWEQQLMNDGSDSRESLVSCEVTNGNLKELLDSVLSPAGLSYHLNNQELTITPATP